VVRAMPVCRRYSIWVSPLARYCSSSFSISPPVGGSADALQEVRSLYPERGVAFSYGRISGKRLNVVMTFATRWRMFKV
jgi:hypothetical protein